MILRNGWDLLFERTTERITQLRTTERIAVTPGGRQTPSLQSTTRQFSVCHSPGFQIPEFQKRSKPQEQAVKAAQCYLQRRSSRFPNAISAWYRLQLFTFHT